LWGAAARLRGKKSKQKRKKSTLISHVLLSCLKSGRHTTLGREQKNQGEKGKGIVKPHEEKVILASVVHIKRKRGKTLV